MRAVGAILAGLAAAIVLIAAVDFVAHLMYAPAEPVDTNDPEAVARTVASMPFGAFAIIVLGWGIGTFTGAYIAARIGRSAAYGFVIGAVILAATIANLYMIQQPVGMWVAGIITVVVTAFIAVRSAIPARARAA
jgi:hypothetical protein